MARTQNRLWNQTPYLREIHSRFCGDLNLITCYLMEWDRRNGVINKESRLGELVLDRILQMESEPEMSDSFGEVLV